MELNSEHFILWLAGIFLAFGWIAGYEPIFNTGVVIGFCSYAVDLMKRVKEVKL